MQTSASVVKQGWLRVVFFLIGYTTLILAIAPLSTFINVKELLPVSKVFNNFTGSIFTSFIISILVVWIFCKLVDKRSFVSLGWQRKGCSRESMIGLFTGLLLVTIIASVLWAMQLSQWFITGETTTNMLLVLLLMIFVAVAEELVFRGYILGNLMQSMNKELALFISALLFAVFHLLNPSFNTIGFINIFIAGLLLGINFIFTRNLWFSVFLHFAWNFLQGPVLGFTVSGIELPSLLAQILKGSILFTGAKFGLEASLLTTIVMSITTLIYYYLFRSKYITASIK